MKTVELSIFKKYIKPLKAISKTNSNNLVWVYTRVSSKDQSENFSLDIQKRKAEEYCNQHGFVIVDTFGGTYESASEDLSRKEFQRMISKVKTADVKPFAILVYKANRFSRTGINGISLLNELINEQNVHLIEVSTGISTLNPRSELQISQGLLDARKENLDRLDVTLPGMITFLKQGNWLGHAPKGYSHYGTRVKDFSLKKSKQEIIINEEGKLLRKAWELKLKGYNDSIIKKKLNDWGLNVSRQFLSSMWRNPFYCGINTNRLLSEPIKGNWSPLITEIDFLKVQKQLESNNSGYVIEKGNNIRPLMGTILCSQCGMKLTGYEVKNKSLHYYNCPRCNGVIINAETTSRAKGKGANQLFIELLKRFTLPSKYLPLISEQLNKLFDAKYYDGKEEERILNLKLHELNSQK